MIQYIIQTIYRFLLPFNAFKGIRPDRFLDMHDIVFDQIDKKSAWLVLGVIVNCHIRIVLIPAPVFLSCQCIPEQAAVCD